MTQRRLPRARGETALLWIITLTGWLVFIALLLWTLTGK